MHGVFPFDKWIDRVGRVNKSLCQGTSSVNFYSKLPPAAEIL